MTVHLDHITCSCTNFEAAAQFLGSQGWRLVFRETSLPNLPVKKPFVGCFSAKQQAALFRRDDSLAIEITTYDAAQDARAWLLPVFSGLPPEFTRASHGVGSFSTVMLTPLEAAACAGAETDGTGFSVRNLVVRTASVQRSVEFWCSLGMVVEGGDSQPTVLGYSSCLTGTIHRLYLFQDPTPARSRLDDRGFNCLAFLTTSLDAERRQLVDQGCRVSDTGEVVLHGRGMRILFAAGPCGEMVELIEVLF